MYLIDKIVVKCFYLLVHLVFFSIFVLYYLIFNLLELGKSGCCSCAYVMLIEDVESAIQCIYIAQNPFLKLNLKGAKVCMFHS